MVIPQEIVNIEHLLTEFLGESKSGLSDDGQIQFPCPRCIDEKGPQEAAKYNLEVNLFRMVYHCWSCSTTEDDMKGPLSRLIKKYGNHSIYSRYRDEIDSLVKSKEYSLEEFGPINVSDIEKVMAKLPVSYTKIDLETCRNVTVVDYCLSRGLTQDIIDRFNLGYTDDTDPDYSWRRRIVIPSYDKYGELNYCVGRDYTGRNKKRKYKNCDAKRNDVIFQESLVNWDADIVLVEGAIDCLYYPNSIAMLGKDLETSSMLFKTLTEKANGHVIIAIDGDTTMTEIKRLYTMLDRSSLRGRVRYIEMAKVTECKDFGAVYEKYGRKGIIDVMRHVRKFTDFELYVMR